MADSIESDREATDSTAAEFLEPQPAECCGGGDEVHSCSIVSADGIVRPGPLGGCPIALYWKQIRATFRQQSTSWEVARQGYSLQGRTWGNGPPLYILCGMGSTLTAFCLLVYLLKDSFRCVIFNYPGSVKSKSAGRRATIATLRDDLLAAADFHGDRQFHIFANSFGGLAALETLRAAPDRIVRAVIQGGFARRRFSLTEWAIAIAGSLLPGRLRSLPGAKALQERNHRRWFPSHDPTRWQFFLEDAGTVPNATLGRRGVLIGASDLRSDLPQIKQPVLLIRSEGDELVPAHCHDELMQGLPNAKSEWMPNAGHLPHLTNPHRLAKSISEFLLPS
ncbi:MAG: Alpha/beta hydrolase family protein [Planctomycetaceae bacterium]|nr:Alpha/beta hydrolase family protein [Planctomycetaceae bacterium]